MAVVQRSFKFAISGIDWKPLIYQILGKNIKALFNCKMKGIAFKIVSGGNHLQLRLCILAAKEIFCLLNVSSKTESEEIGVSDIVCFAVPTQIIIGIG